MSDERCLFVDEVLMPETREEVEKALAEEFGSGFTQGKVQLETGEVFKHKTYSKDCTLTNIRLFLLLATVLLLF